METSRKSESIHFEDRDEALILAALRSSLELLGGPEQTGRVFQYLQNEYGLSPDKQQGIDERTIASALTNLFGRGSELLLIKFREEIARSGMRSSRPKAKPEYSDVETLSRTQSHAKGGRK